MDEDEMVDALEPGDPLQRQLARYARVRLEPDPAAMRRARAAVMEAAWRQRLDAQAAPVAIAARTTHVPFAGWSTRRLGSTFAAAVLAGLLVAGTVFAGSRAGGPLYDARLGLEAALLPSDATARVQAQLALAQTRLAEASQAAAVADEGALEAALAAYGEIVGDIAHASGAPAAQALAAVHVHLDVLRALQSRLPAAAGPAIANAIERSGGAIDRLEHANAGGPGGAGAPGGGKGGNGNGSGNGNGGNGNGGNGNGEGNGGGSPDPATNPASPEPSATAKPEPKPEPTPEPQATPRVPSPSTAPVPDPARTPKPSTSDEPPAGDGDSQGG